jgi:uncharacterized damage-inducible protein DinB
MPIIALGQQATVKDAFAAKWERSAEYLIQMASQMPEEAFTYKPTERQMSFAEQLVHIHGNMNWLGSTYFNMPATAKPEPDQSKETIIKLLSEGFAAVGEAVKKTDDQELTEVVDFFAGPKTKLQILNLLQDHVTHHRGQLVVYLNLKQLEPPRYVGW